VHLSHPYINSSGRSQEHFLAISSLAVRKEIWFILPLLADCVSHLESGFKIKNIKAERGSSTKKLQIAGRVLNGLFPGIIPF
jgi:hypothetical protein